MRQDRKELFKIILYATWPSSLFNPFHFNHWRVFVAAGWRNFVAPGSLEATEERSGATLCEQWRPARDLSVEGGVRVIKTRWWSAFSGKVKAGIQHSDQSDRLKQDIIYYIFKDLQQNPFAKKLNIIIFTQEWSFDLIYSFGRGFKLVFPKLDGYNVLLKKRHIYIFTLNQQGGCSHHHTKQESQSVLTLWQNNKKKILCEITWKSNFFCTAHLHTNQSKGRVTPSLHPFHSTMQREKNDSTNQFLFLMRILAGKHAAPHVSSPSVSHLRRRRGLLQNAKKKKKKSAECEWSRNWLQGGKAFRCVSASERGGKDGGVWHSVCSSLPISRMSAGVLTLWGAWQAHKKNEMKNPN